MEQDHTKRYVENQDYLEHEKKAKWRREDPTGNAEENVNVGGRSITRDEDAGNVEACEGTAWNNEADSDVDGWSWEKNAGNPETRGNTTGNGRAHVDVGRHVSISFNVAAKEWEDGCTWSWKNSTCRWMWISGNAIERDQLRIRLGKKTESSRSANLHSNSAISVLSLVFSFSF